MSKSIRTKALAGWGIPVGRTFLIAGPCSAESKGQLARTARSLRDGGVSLLRAGIWKPRTRPGCYEGPGEEGLAWLVTAGREAGLKTTTEVATPEHVDMCLRAGVDVLWIGARTSGNPFAVQAVADALRGVDVPVMVKNPLSPDVDLWAGALERVNRVGVDRLAAIHRGFAAQNQGTYRNEPMWRIPIELRRRAPSVPILCDPSHICGKRELVPAVAQMALDLLFEGLMIEVHERPAKALSDAAQQITPARLKRMMGDLRIAKASTGETAVQQQLRLMRHEIDIIDNELLALLGQRMELVRDLGELKLSHNVSAFQPQRWEQIVRTRIRSGVRHQLSKQFVKSVFEQIHEEALRQQEGLT